MPRRVMILICCIFSLVEFLDPGARGFLPQYGKKCLTVMPHCGIFWVLMPRFGKNSAPSRPKKQPQTMPSKSRRLGPTPFNR